MKNILMTCLSVCSLGVSCNEMIDAPMLLVVLFSVLSACYCSHYTLLSICDIIPTMKIKGLYNI